MNTTSETGTEIRKTVDESTAEHTNLKLINNIIDNTNFTFEILQENDTFSTNEASGCSHKKKEFIEHFDINKIETNIVSQNEPSSESHIKSKNEKENILDHDVDSNTKKIKFTEKQDAGCKASDMYRRKCRNANLFNLHNLLQKSCIGQGIIKDYEKNNTLSKKSRNSLVSLIINDFLDKSM